MRILIKRFFAVIMSLLLIMSFFLSQSISVRAEIKSYTWGELKENAEYFIFWVYSQMGAVFKDHDFAKFLANEEGFNSYFNQDHVSVNNGSITIDKEFMQWLKNWLINYSKQQQIYVYGWSTGFDEIPYSTFSSWKVCYDTVSNVIDTIPSGAINLGITSSVYNGNYYCDIYIAAYDNLRDVGFVGNPNYSVTHLSMSTWANVAPDVYALRLYSGDSAITSWDEFKEKAMLNTYISNGNKISSTDYFRNCTLLCNEVARNRVPSIFLTDTRLALVTRNRTTFRVFRDTDYLFDYSLDKRGIYFTSDFWDYEPSDFTGTLDDLNNSIDRMDDILKRLLDKIDNTTDEKTIEDLLKQILEEIKNNGSGNGSGSGSSGSGNYDGFFGAILSYLDLIVDYLAGILEGIENLVFLEWTSQDSDLDDFKSLWKGIKEDPESGSQAAAAYQ